MQFRIWVLVVLALVLATIAGCASLRGGRGPALTPTPVKTLRPTFTSTPAKPKPTATPQSAAPAAGQPVAANAPAGGAQAATATTQPATSTPEPSPTPVPPSPTAEKAAFTVSSPGASNVRSGPGTNYSRIGEVRQGQTYEITGKNQAGTWWQFNFNGQAGWISGDLVSANAAAGSVKLAANIPAPPVQPTARPAPPPQPTAAPAPPAAPNLFAQTGNESRNVDNTNFNLVTFWGRLGQTGGTAIGGGYRLKVDAPSGSKEVPFGDIWLVANPGLPSEFRYNAKIELPRTAGSFRAVVLDGAGREVSDVISGGVQEVTHDVIITWWPR